MIPDAQQWVPIVVGACTLVGTFGGSILGIASAWFLMKSRITAHDDKFVQIISRLVVLEASALEVARLQSLNVEVERLKELKVQVASVISKVDAMRDGMEETKINVAIIKTQQAKNGH